MITEEQADDLIRAVKRLRRDMRELAESFAICAAELRKARNPLNDLHTSASGPLAVHVPELQFDGVAGQGLRWPAGGIDESVSWAFAPSPCAAANPIEGGNCVRPAGHEGAHTGISHSVRWGDSLACAVPHCALGWQHTGPHMFLGDPGMSQSQCDSTAFMEGAYCQLVRGHEERGAPDHMFFRRDAAGPLPLSAAARWH